jgi:amino acid adenylation domain-containing protein
MLDALAQRAVMAPADQKAIVDGTRRLTYPEVLGRARRYASVLKDRGVARGDRVAIFLPRSADAVVALFATWFAGGVAVIVNERLSASRVYHIVEHSGASAVVTSDKQLISVPYFPCDNVINVDQVLPGEPCVPERVIGADLALLLYTCGSTGPPKGVMLSHDNLLSGAQIVADYLNLTDQDVILSVLPFSFDYGLNQVLTAILAGGTLVIRRSVFSRDIGEALRRHHVTGLAGVPSLWLQLTARYSAFLKEKYPTLRYVTNAGGRLPEHALRQIRTAHPHVEVFLMYGLTEAFRSTFLPPADVDSRPASIGKAIPNVEVLVVNESGRLCEPGEVGELVHRGANITMGYWRDPAGSARLLRPHPLAQLRNGSTELVVFSGDLVRQDADGYLYYVGRKDTLIKSRGVHVSPEEIESCILSSSLVSNAVSFGVPRDDGDQDIVAAVIPRDISSFRKEALEAFCWNEMPVHMRPSSIWPLSEFPLTMSGKPDRRRIQQMYAERTENAGNTAPAVRAV